MTKITGNLRREDVRLATFLEDSQWPEMANADYPVGAAELAKSGFYYTGKGDIVLCAFCRLEIRNWEQGDTADGEHRRWNEKCPFLRGWNMGNVPLCEPQVPSSSQPPKTDDRASASIEVEIY